METCLALGRLAKAVIYLRWVIVAFWLIGASLAAAGAAKFLSVTSLSFDAPKGTKAYDEKAYAQTVFPSIVDVSEFVAILEVTPPQQVLELPGLRQFSFALRDSLNASGELIAYTSNATLWYGQNISTGPGLVAAGGSATIVQWSIASDPTDQAAIDFAKDAEKKFQDEVARSLPELSFSGITSVPTLESVAIADSETSLEKMDGIAMPMAFAILWIVVRSGRLLLITLVCMGVALSVSFGVMYCVGTRAVVETSTPSLMMSLLIAMSIDYSLFMLTRFREEIALVDVDLDMTAAVRCALEKTMESAGCMILLSGVTLALSFMVLAFFPLEMFSSMGVGCSVSLVIALVVHLTLLPAILAAFPRFFGWCVDHNRCGARFFGRCASARSREGGSNAVPGCAAGSGMGHSLGVNNGLSTSSRVSAGSLGGEGALLPHTPTPRAAKRRQPFWESVARRTTAFPANVIIVLAVALGTGALGVAILHTKVTGAFVMALPRGTHTYDAFGRLIATFGIGAINPYRVLMEAGDGAEPGSVLTKDFWERSQNVLEALTTRLPQTKPEDFEFMSYVQGQAVPWEVARVCLNGTPPPVIAPLCNDVAYAVDRFSNPDKSAAFAMITLKFDPCGNDGSSWLDQARTTLEDLSQSSGMKLTLTGLAASTVDTMTQSYHIFPFMIGTTLLVAVALLGAAFGSLVIPLRCVGSIILTLFWVYGLATLTFQDGILDWVGFAGVNSKFKAQNWFLPLICFSLVVGICLDYDIFLITRTTEFRAAGMSPNEAIQQGVCSTGGIITAAGVIMAIAFGGLMFANIVLVNGLSFYMVFAVLYDTFIVRCLFTPAAMSLLGRWNWFPSKLYKRDWCRTLPG